jgi:RNA polymerase sigma factor (sigma-70 family)
VLIRKNLDKENVSLRETFSRLYDEYMPKVYRYIYYKVHDVPTAEDITSQAFEKALVNFSKYSHDKGEFSVWMISIARNTIADYYRAQGKLKTTFIDEAIDLPSDEPDPQEVMEEDDEKQTLQACIARLPPDEQEIVRLKFTMEITNREIAKTVGLSESNVGVKLYRIIRKLRESFQEPQYG